MKYVPPFVTGYAVTSLVVGAGVGGSMRSIEAVAVGVGLLVFGALAACLVCWWLLGFEAPWLRLLALGLFANPTFLLAVAFVLIDAGCIFGSRRGWDCLGAALAVVVAAAALPTPLGGLFWRWWKGRRPPA